MGRKRKHSTEQVRLVSLGPCGPTPERARQAGERLVRHAKTGEMRVNPDKTEIEPLPSGAVRVAQDPLHRLHARGAIDLPLYEAGRRFERMIYAGSLDNGARAQQYEGAHGGSGTGIPYSITLQAIQAREEVARIRVSMASVWYQAVEWCIVSSMTLEQGASLTGVAGQSGQAVYLDRLKAALSWLADWWGMR